MSGASYAGRAASHSPQAGVTKRNRSHSTRPELLLGEALAASVVSYRRNVRELPGSPDFVFDEARIAVFCDGDYWHGRRWAVRRRRLSRGHNAEYWIAKIGGNRLRDRRVNADLRSAGWTVIRLWETDIRSAPAAAAHRILTALARPTVPRQRRINRDSNAKEHKCRERKYAPLR